MTKHLPFYALLAASCAVGAATNQTAVAAKPQPPAPAAPAKPVAKTPAPKPAAKKADKPFAEPMPAGEEIDDIDFEAIDDSALAAKARPTVKAVKPAPAAKAPAATPELTGTEVAARYLAQDETALIDIVSDDATLADILRQFRKTTGANIIYAASSNLNRRVSVSLTHVPWLQAMTSILGAHGYRVESTSGIHYIREDQLATPVFTRTFQLNHASADELAKLFNTSYGITDKDGKVLRSIATPFPGANAVVVTTTERVLSDCEKIVKAVDKAAPQIYIEARFIELSNEALHKLGVQWNQLESWGASVKNMEGGMGYANGSLNRFYQGKTTTMYTPKSQVGDTWQETTGKSEVDYVTKNYLVGSSTESDLGDMAWRNSRVFSGQLSVDDFNLAMSAFESMSDVKIFSNPKIIVSNGKEAKVDMTTKFPNVRITATRNTSNGSDSLDISTQLEVIPGEDKLLFAKEAFFSWGITLSVKPRISPDGLISVEIIPQISQLDTSVVMDEDQTPTGFIQVKGGDSSAMSYYPVIEVKRLTTDFTMKDGATAVIGGLTKTTEEDVDSGIPYLREIPWIGNRVFGWKSRGKVQKEILVFVTVGIADPANLNKDVGLPKNAVIGREYVEGRLFEPGDRTNAVEQLTTFDMRPVDKRTPRPAADAREPAPASASAPAGTVTITPVAAGDRLQAK